MVNDKQAAVLSGRDIVIIGLQAWYTDIGSNCKSIALELSKTNRVLYINMPLDRNTRMNRSNDLNIAKHIRIIKNKEDDLICIGNNLWNYFPHRILESINRIPVASIFNLFNKINNKRFADDIKEAAGRLGFQDYILFNDNDIFRSFYLKELLKPSLYIYYSRDNLLGVDYWKKHGSRLEPAHIKKADIAVANSIYLANYLRKYNANSFYIGQGCNTELFDIKKSYEIPEDIKNIPGPRIGYIGAISSLRIDENIIRIIASSLPKHQIIMVGPEDEFFSRSPLHSMKNIHFLGKKPVSTLPSYISCFDVCINPQLINEITIGNYPLKVDEYMSMGKPVVATRTDAMNIFEGKAYMASQIEEFPELILQALNENNVLKINERVQLANSHTWQHSIEQLTLAIRKTI